MPRRYRDEYDDDFDDPDDIDRDPDAEYRRRVDRYGEEMTDEDEDEAEKEEADSESSARKKSLWPGLVWAPPGGGTRLGSVGFVVTPALGGGAGGGGGGGAAVSWISLGLCAGIPLLFTAGFTIMQLVGGVCLVRRKGRGMAISGAILGVLAAVPIIYVGLVGNFPPTIWMALGPCLLSLPAGVWTFIAANDTDVQEAFARNKRYD